MKPSFQLVHQHYPKVGKREELYPLIGWTDLTDNPVFLDTCAIRMSMALLGAGVTLPGARMVANDGTLKGKRIEPGQARLSGILKRIWAILKYSWMRAVRRRASAAGAAWFRFSGSTVPSWAAVDISTCSGQQPAGSINVRGAATSVRRKHGSGH